MSTLENEQVVTYLTMAELEDIVIHILSIFSSPVNFRSSSFLKLLNI
jgi:hypothetical protein